MHRLVLAGGGIGAIPDIVVARSLASGAIERVLPEWTVASVRLHAISLGGWEAPARVRLFRDFMRTELAAALRLIQEENTGGAPLGQPREPSSK